MSKRSYKAAFGRAVGTLGGMAMNNRFNLGFNYTRSTNRAPAGGGAGGVRFSKEAHRFGRRRRRNKIRLDDLFRGYAKLRTRWQLTSPTLIGPGRVPISFGVDTTSAANFETLPIHMISLTTNMIGEANTSKGAHKKGLFRFVRDSATGTVGWNWFDAQMEDGVNTYNGTGEWEWEARNDFGLAPQDKFFHKWSEIRLNLYGSKYMPLTYTITFVTMPKEFDPQQIDSWVPGSPNQLEEFNECTRMLEDLVRPLISNPINVSGTKQHWKDKVRILKQYKVNMAPLSYSNAADETTAPVHVGNVKQFKTFIRHDRWRNYNWADRISNVDPDRDLNDLGWDHTDSEKVSCELDWGKRVYMIISCTTGPRVDKTAYSVYSHLPAQYTSMPDYEGTYDIMVRNEFMVENNA